MAGLREQLREDLKSAMRARDVVRRGTIRMVEAAIKNAEIERREPLDDDAAAQIVQKQVKLRQEAIAVYDEADRKDLADKERAELAVLTAYLPEQMSRDAIVVAVQAAIDAVGAGGPNDKGKVMGPLMKELRGKADGRLVNEVVTELLGS